MIGRLNGLLVETDGEEVIVDVAGVGYRLSVPLSTSAGLPPIGNKVTLNVHTHVRDDALLLFGFFDRSELKLFQTLIGVSGIGPRLALTILSHFTPDSFASAVINDETSRLTKVPGIGKKTAARIILELKDRLKKSWVFPDENDDLGHMNDGVSLTSDQDDALVALVSLGFSEPEVTQVLSRIGEDQGQSSVEQLIQKALRKLDRGAS